MPRKKVQRYDTIKLNTSKIDVSDEGFITIPVMATRAGVFKYVKQDGSVIRELRPPEEVFDSDSMESLAKKPVTNNHPTAKLLHSANAKKFTVGLTGENVEKVDEFLETKTTIF